MARLVTREEFRAPAHTTAASVRQKRPGIRPNVSRRSVGLSAGIRGARSSINSDGRRTTSVAIPGSGLSYRSQRGLRARPSGRGPFHAVRTTSLLLLLLYALAGKVVFFTILGAAVVSGIVLVTRRRSRV
ncbi:MAG: DUF4236 domain-containing protein [Actinobacteria bacterium]|nr:MAG: DUF4236 domain-containing protein [Actinomycetota bacterium]